MLMTTFVLVVVAMLWLLATAQGIWSLTTGIRFYRYMTRHLRDGAEAAPATAPTVSILLPCCGLDDRLQDTVQALGALNYPDYEVIFAFESMDDPAYAAIGRWAAGWRSTPWRRVVAGRTEFRSQKIHNLLAGLNIVSADRDVLVFLDSDAIPHPNWLQGLVAPLADSNVGASTGFRWYTTNGNIASGVRSAWNAATVTFLHDEKLNFCWGGSTAIRRDTFDRLRVAASWQRALSDDYQVTRAVRNADLKIVFVPQCLIPCIDRTTFRGFLTFARRQLVITRVCAPLIWRTGLALACNFILGATAAACLALYAYMHSQRELMILGLAGWGLILALAGAKSMLRQLAVRQVLQPGTRSWKDFMWDVGGVGIIGVLHLGLLLSSARSRRITWRSMEYEMVSADETIVRGRPAPAETQPAPAPMVGLT